jgi:hypothetical protein
MSNEVTGNIFFRTGQGYKAHLQVKRDLEEGEDPSSLLVVLGQLEAAIGLSGGTTEAFTDAPKRGPELPPPAGKPEFGARQDMGDGQCPNGCGPRPLVPAGVSKKPPYKPYGAFWGECRTCGYKNRR